MACAVPITVTAITASSPWPSSGLDPRRGAAPRGNPEIRGAVQPAGIPGTQGL